MNTVETTEESNPSKVIYTAKVHTTGGREGGTSRSSDGRLDVKISLPGAPSQGTNPEQLFAAGWSTCFLSAIKIAANQRKILLPPEVGVDGEVDLHMGNDGCTLSARLKVSLPGPDATVAEELLEAAHGMCPYSRATRGNIDVAIQLAQAA